MKAHQAAVVADLPCRHADFTIPDTAVVPLVGPQT